MGMERTAAELRRRRHYRAVIGEQYVGSRSIDVGVVDYPNAHDRERYWEALEAGDLPREGDDWVGIGGMVGIHGTDKPGLNGRNVDWTLGCISLQNRDVADLAAMVPVGTLVLIED